MERSIRQLYAVASLIGTCEAIAESGTLTQPLEQSLRLLIAETLSAHNMQPRENNHEYIRSASFD